MLYGAGGIGIRINWIISGCQRRNNYYARLPHHSGISARPDHRLALRNVSLLQNNFLQPPNLATVTSSHSWTGATSRMDGSHSEHETGADSGGLHAQPRLEVMTITDVTMWLKKEGFAEDVLSAFDGESVKSSQFNGVCAECAFSGTYIIDAPTTWPRN